MQQVRDGLRAKGLEVWTDENLKPGTRSWKNAIQNALESANCLVVIFSPHSKQSEWVQEEMNYAEAQDIRIFPILAKGDVKTSVPFGFITAQWIDVRADTDFSSELDKLVASVRAHLGVSKTSENKTQDKSAAIHAAEQPSPVIAPIDLSPQATKAIEILSNKESKWWRRADAARTLGELRDRALLPTLEAFLNDTDKDVQQAVERAIEQIQSPDLKLPPVHRINANINEATASNTNDKAGTSEAGSSKQQAKEKVVLKTIIAGRPQSGSTTFLRTASEIELVTFDSIDVPMEFGRVTADNLTINLFSIPSKSRFDFMWQTMVEGTHGFIIMVDSTAPDEFKDTKSVLNTLHSMYRTPYVIAASKQDMPDAWSVDRIRAALAIGPDIPVLPCVATDWESVKNVLLELLFRILDELDS